MSGITGDPSPTTGSVRSDGLSPTTGGPRNDDPSRATGGPRDDGRSGTTGGRSGIIGAARDRPEGMIDEGARPGGTIAAGEIRIEYLTTMNNGRSLAPDVVVEVVLGEEGALETPLRVTRRAMYVRRAGVLVPPIHHEVVQPRRPKRS